MKYEPDEIAIQTSNGKNKAIKSNMKKWADANPEAADRINL